MPINYQKVRDQVREYGEKARLRDQQIHTRRQRALDLLARFSARGDELAAAVARAAQGNPGLRCAVPLAEPLMARYALGSAPACATLLAADGSQINPDRHDQLEYCLINVGLVTLISGSGQAPETRIDSRLLDPDEVVTPSGLITEGTVALKRDLEERQKLVELALSARAGGAPEPLISLTDGPLELYWEPNPTREFEQAFEKYLQVLDELSETGAATAGYVDKPGSGLLVRLLEVADLLPDRLSEAGKTHPLQGLTDIGLLYELLCEPGDRSAVFAIQSQTAQKFQARLALRFFYLNVGRPGEPNLVRVEIPEWVAGDAAMLSALQAVLVAQCRIMGARPYPYVLHRAHEMALVRMEEKDRLRDMLVAELYRQGVSVGKKSNKQASKDLSGRTRYKR